MENRDEGDGEEDNEDALQAVLIDFGQAIDIRHPMATDLLKKDLAAMRAFFKKQGIKTLGSRMALEFVTADPEEADDYESTIVESEGGGNAESHAAETEQETGFTSNTTEHIQVDANEEERIDHFEETEYVTGEEDPFPTEPMEPTIQDDNKSMDAVSTESAPSQVRSRADTASVSEATAESQFPESSAPITSIPPGRRRPDNSRLDFGPGPFPVGTIRHDSMSVAWEPEWNEEVEVKSPFSD